MLILREGDYRLDLAPEMGGCVTGFSWSGQSLFRPACGPSILDASSFPLVPFSNRIAWGRFSHAGREISLRPNFPGSDHPHPLHGFGWLVPWDVAEVSNNHALLDHHHPGRQWPWPYRAEQRFSLSEDGLVMGLSVTNLGEAAMPAGLGFHPYFPRDPDTIYCGRHRGEWETDEEGLPLQLHREAGPKDWWAGQPVASRLVDTVYEDRDGPLTIQWPSRGYRVKIAPSDNITRTVVYTPAGQDFFCVEPVTHATNAHNGASDLGLVWLGRGETQSISVHVQAHRMTSSS